jgi:hypothetical protein
MTLEHVLYTAKAHTTGGRNGGDSHRRWPARRQAFVAGRPEYRTNPQQLSATRL